METTNGSQLNLDNLCKIVPSCFTGTKAKDGCIHRVVDFTKQRLFLGNYTVEFANARRYNMLVSTLTPSLTRL